MKACAFLAVLLATAPAVAQTNCGQLPKTWEGTAYAVSGDTLAGIDKAQQNAAQKLRRYAAIYADVLRANRMCLCGMMASDYATLPKPMRERVRHFFDENERWLARVLDEGRKAGQLAFKGPPVELARMIVASLEGAMMLARSYSEPPRFDAAAERVIAELEPRTSV